LFDDWINILIISAHTDDAEICMGGTIRRLISAGYNVHHAILSYAPHQSEERGYTRDTLKNESKMANICLGIKSENYHIFDLGYPTDYFHNLRQEIANSLNKLKMMIKPDVVFVHSSFDTHSDHNVVYNECTRIFKEIGIIGYEFPYNNLSFDYDLLVGLTEDNMYTKIVAIDCFQSQQDRVYTNEEYIRSLGRVNAVRMKSQYPFAEAFEVVRIIW